MEKQNLILCGNLASVITIKDIHRTNREHTAGFHRIDKILGGDIFIYYDRHITHNRRKLRERLKAVNKANIVEQDGEVKLKHPGIPQQG
jgi:hypothetical protein